MLEEYKEICRMSAELVPNWKNLSKNELCRQYVANKDDPTLQNGYLAAILYRYWGLISKYYYMSANCATPEDCYEWLVDSVLCCVNLASWEKPDSSIHNDPNGPDKVINRCMKCARLTYYQFINRKKRRDDFGLLSIDELQELFGSSVTEPKDDAQDINVSTLYIRDYVVQKFKEKDYFVSFLLDCILSDCVFDIVKDENYSWHPELNLRKLCKSMTALPENFAYEFSANYDLDINDVKKGLHYVNVIPQGSMRKKILQTLEQLKHSTFAKALIGGDLNAY